MSRGISASDPQTWERALRFGDAVRTHRKAHGLTQEQLAERAGCDRLSVSRVECAVYSPSLLRVLRLADALGVAPAALFAGIPANGDRPSTEETR